MRLTLKCIRHRRGWCSFCSRPALGSRLTRGSGWGYFDSSNVLTNYGLNAVINALSLEDSRESSSSSTYDGGSSSSDSSDFGSGYSGSYGGSDFGSGSSDSGGSYGSSDSGGSW